VLPEDLLKPLTDPLLHLPGTKLKDLNFGFYPDLVDDGGAVQLTRWAMKSRLRNGLVTWTVDARNMMRRERLKRWFPAACLYHRSVDWIGSGEDSVHVLIIEDEERLAQNLAKAISKNAGLVVDVALEGNDGLHLALTGSFDLVILDLMLPGISGEKVLTEIRNAGNRTPVLVLTAKEDKQTVVGLLDNGADDYLAKPFDLGELLARVKALIRRSKGQASSSLVLADLILDMNTRSASRAGERVELTPMEYRTLEYLMLRQGCVVSKEELLEHLYDYNWEKFSNVIEVYISALRRKVDAGGHERLIHTLRGHGYMLRRGEAV